MFMNGKNMFWYLYIGVDVYEWEEHVLVCCHSVVVIHPHLACVICLPILHNISPHLSCMRHLLIHPS